MAMKILFVKAPRSYSINRPETLPGLGMAILARILNKYGHHVEVIDLSATCQRMTDIKNVNKYDWIGFTVLTSNTEGVQQCIDDLWMAGYKGIIACGGIYATLFPEEVYRWGVDLVVKGECEANILTMVEGQLTGIREGERMDIEDIPAPDWDHHHPAIDTYNGNIKIVRPRPGITQWTRGCPYSCIFCENKIYNHQPTRYRPPEKIAEEMRYLFDVGIRNVFVYDDETFGTKVPDGWIEGVADRIEVMQFNLVTQGRCSEKYITDDLMCHAKRAGMNTIFWGVESLSQDVLNAIRKRITLDDVWHTLTMAHKEGIKNGVYLQVGNYHETEDNAAETERNLKQLYQFGLVDYLQVFVTGVMPGTELADMAQAEGWYQEPPPGWNYMKRVMYDGTPWMTKAKIEHWMARYKAACPTEAL
jgi:anaerobic magnesium-protoporphyrin IX monomethyl ester cyclase